MDEKQYSRRACLQAAATGGLGALAVAGARPAQASLNRIPAVKIAGYAYDRVRAIQDGRLGLDRFDVRFHAEDIYSLNKQHLKSLASLRRMRNLSRVYPQ